MIEGNYKAYYYVLEGTRINVYTAKGARSVLKSYEVDGQISAEEVHRVARGRIDLDWDEIVEANRKL